MSRLDECRFFPIEHLTLILDASLTRGSDRVEATKRESKDTKPVKKVCTGSVCMRFLITATVLYHNMLHGCMLSHCIMHVKPLTWLYLLHISQKMFPL